MGLTQNPRKHFQFNQPLSKIFEQLEKEGLLKPESAKNPPNTNSSKYNPHAYCHYHLVQGHHTNDCLKLKYQIQDLIDAGKITNPQARQPNV